MARTSSRNFVRRGRSPSVRSAARLVLECLESRDQPALFSDSVTAVALVESADNDTLDQAQWLGDLLAQPGAAVVGALGGPSGEADVDWYQFTIDRPARVSVRLTEASGMGPIDAVLSLYNSVPWDHFDPESQLGHRRLLQEQSRLDTNLPPGNYSLAVSGAGNSSFHPFLADSGMPGWSGPYRLTVAAEAREDEPGEGPVVLMTDPAPGAQLTSSPWALRITTSRPVHIDSVMLDESVRLRSYPFGEGNGDDEHDVPLAEFHVSVDASELLIVPAFPLAPGHYRLVLSGNALDHATVLTDGDGLPLGASDHQPNGQDYELTFDIVGAEHREGAWTEADDTPAFARDLGDLADATPVQARGTIGDDPTDTVPLPATDVDLYHFRITAEGQHALTAEVFARRQGSPLNAGLSLFRFRPEDGGLELITSNDDTRNEVPASNGQSLPLFADPVVLAGLAPGDYYLAVSSRGNVPIAARGRLPGLGGIFDPLISHSGTRGSSTGAYVLSVMVQRDDTAPEIVRTDPAPGSVLTATPTRLSVRFSESVNLQELAFRAYEQHSEGALAPVWVEGPDGLRYYPRLESFDPVSHEAQFLLLEALPNGAYRAHLSGEQGLADFAGNALRGNGPDGDFTVDFRVEARPRGTRDDPLTWSREDGPGQSSGPYNVGPLFPRELEAGVRFVRQASWSGPGTTSEVDVYQFELLQAQSYLVFLDSTAMSEGLRLWLTDDTGQEIDTTPQGDGSGLLALLLPGRYQLHVAGRDGEGGPPTGYEVRMVLGGSLENPPPLTVGASPVVRLRLADGLASGPGTSTSSPPSVPTAGPSAGTGNVPGPRLVLSGDGGTGSGSATSTLVAQRPLAFPLATFPIFPVLGDSPVGGTATAGPGTRPREAHVLVLRSTDAASDRGAIRTAGLPVARLSASPGLSRAAWLTSPRSVLGVMHWFLGNAVTLLSRSRAWFRQWMQASSVRPSPDGTMRSEPADGGHDDHIPQDGTAASVVPSGTTSPRPDSGAEAQQLVMLLGGLLTTTGARSMRRKPHATRYPLLRM